MRIKTVFQLSLCCLAGFSLAACGIQRTPAAPTVAATQNGESVRPYAPAFTPGIGPVTGERTPIALLMTATPTTNQPAINTPVFQPTFGPLVVNASTQTPTQTPPSTNTPNTAGGPLVATPNMTRPAFGPALAPNFTPPSDATPVPPTVSAAVLPPPVTPGPSPTAGPQLRRDLMGVQIHAYLTDAQFSAMLDRATELGVGWVKIQVNWELYEPQPGQTNDLYAGSVLNVQRASIRGFKVMLSFAKAPDWARPEAARGQEDGPPDDPAQLATFIGRYVRDVKPEFIDAIEVWNEPNLVREWRGKPINGAEYMRYFRASYEAIQREQKAGVSALKPTHRIMVITAGPAPTVTFTGSTVGDREFIQQLYDAGLAEFGPDVALGGHPYGWGNPPEAFCCNAGAGITGWFEHPSFYFRETLDAYRKIMQNAGDNSRKLWVTEFGWATYDGLLRTDGAAAKAETGVGWQALINQTQQADYVVRAFQLAQQPPYYEFLGPMMLWNLNFALVPGMVDNGGEQAGFSLLDGNGQPRPVFVAVRNAPKQ
jgi:polysaccharide biosynthesis protein PslG